MSYYSSTLQKGSKGDETKKWQEFLNTQGYGLSVDGDFGDKTDAATRDYQQKNGLTVDGIVGANTWGKAGFSNIKTPVSAPTTSPMPTKPEYVSTSWDATTKGEAALGAYNTAKGNVNNYKTPEWADQGKYDNLIKEYENRPDFTYDFNGDALYQQYKDKFIQQGKMAMADTMGQAAAMTGGYGNSYAATVGNQAYQSHLSQLNDVIPELYQLAYSRYQNEGQDMLNMIELLKGERAHHYDREADNYNKLLGALGIASDNYYKGADMHYTEQSNENDAASKAFTDAMSIWENETNNAWKKADWDESMRRAALEQEQNAQKMAIVQNSGGKVILDEKGNFVLADEPLDGGENDLGVPSSIQEKAKSFSTNSALESYLDGLEKDGEISPEQADELYASNKKSEYDLKDRTWSMKDKGGLNWFWGVDNNAEVKDQYGNAYRLDALVEALQKEGMSKKEAKNYVKQLQKDLDL